MDEKAEALQEIVRAHRNVVPAIGTLFSIGGLIRANPFTDREQEIDEAIESVWQSTEQMRHAVRRYKRLSQRVGIG